MSPTERTQITYRQERWRCVCAGLLETAGNTFLLLLAVRHYQAGSMAKALIAGGGSGGLLLSPLAVNLTHRLGWPLTDSDAAIEAREGATVRAIRERLGTAALHALEARQLREALGTPGHAVICAAASTVDDPACRKALLEGASLLVWLTALPATAAGRFDHQGHRPRYGEDTETFLARQAIERGSRFRSLDPVELATDERSAEDLASEVVRLARGG